jgi:regulatory protein
MWRKGRKPIDDQERVIKDRDKARERTMNRAVKLLAAKPRSVTELRERLLEKSWTDSDIVTSVIEKLKEYKYLDDAQFARDAALSKLRQRPQGKRALQYAMSRKKIDRETIEAAVKDAFEKMPEQKLIDTAIEKRLRLKGVPETREDKKKFFDYLLRLGFEYDLIRDKMSSLSKDLVDD